MRDQLRVRGLARDREEDVPDATVPRVGAEQAEVPPRVPFEDRRRVVVAAGPRGRRGGVAVCVYGGASVGSEGATRAGVVAAGFGVGGALEAAGAAGGAGRGGATGSTGTGV